MHASVSDAFWAANVRMPLFMSPYAEACDKGGFDGTSKKVVEEDYASWAERHQMNRKSVVLLRLLPVKQWRRAWSVVLQASLMMPFVTLTALPFFPTD